MILKLLNESEHLYVTEIVDCLGIQRAQMTASADRLIELGYIGRSPDNKEQRKINLFITESGKGLVDEIVKQVRKKIEKILFKLSSKEIRVLEDGLGLFMKLCSICKEIEDEERI